MVSSRRGLQTTAGTVSSEHAYVDHEALHHHEDPLAGVPGSRALTTPT
jgi:hypothetical protein